jgi:hypothetical protein
MTITQERAEHSSEVTVTGDEEDPRPILAAIFPIGPWTS